MMRYRIKQAAAYFRSRLIRVLLLAVILTSGFSINYAAQAKYAAYLSDYSSAVASDLCFSSNYLGEQNAHMRYNIGTWNGRGYEITLEIRNYFNSMRYNRSGEDLYYYVTAEVYKANGEDQFTREESYLNKAFTSTVTYPDAETTYEYKGQTCAFLPGMAESFDHDAGTQKVTVNITANNAVTEKQYLVIQAHTVPTSEVGEISKDASTPGVFDVTLEAVFVLNRGNSEADIKPTLAQSDTDYTVIYKLTCGAISGSTMSIVKIYFDDEKLDPDVNLGEVKTDDIGSFVSVPMYSESIKNCFFFKKAMDVTVTDGTDIFIRLAEGEIAEPDNGGADDEENADNTTDQGEIGQTGTNEDQSDPGVSDPDQPADGGNAE